MKTCAYRDCEREFEPARHNQKYCTPQCCKDEMNSRAKDAYREKRARRDGKYRECKVCKTKLSKYNDDVVCGACEFKPREELLQEVWDIVNA